MFVLVFSDFTCFKYACFCFFSDDRNDVTEQLFIDPNVGGNDYFGCPASPTTVPARTPQCLESPARTGPPRRRQRTTSMNNQTTTANPSECVIRTTNNRTIYTAGRPPWYNCAGQQVEPFVIGNLIRFTHKCCSTANTNNNNLQVFVVARLQEKRQWLKKL